MLADRLHISMPILVSATLALFLSSTSALSQQSMQSTEQATGAPIVINADGTSLPVRSGSPANSAQTLTPTPTNSDLVALPETQIGNRANEVGVSANPVQDSPILPNDTGYDPEPLRAGIFDVSGQLDLVHGYSSNAEQEQNGESGQFTQARLSTQAVSDWSSHELRLSLDAQLDFYRSKGAKQQELSTQSQLSLDLKQNSQLNLSAGYSVQREDINSLGANFSVDNAPLIHQWRNDISYNRDAGRLALELGAGLTTTRYSDIDTNAGTISQTERGRNEAELSATARLDSDASISPFVRLGYEYGGRQTKLDTNGINRKFQGFRGSVGAVLDNSEKLTGSLSAGYAQRKFKDSQLDELSGFIADANVSWSPWRNLALSANAQIDFSAQEAATISGATRSQLGVSADWSVLENWDLGLGLNFERLAYSNDDKDTQTSFEVSSSYWLNTYMGVSGAARYIKQDSTRANASYDETQIELGVSLRH